MAAARVVSFLRVRATTTPARSFGSRQMATSPGSNRAFARRCAREAPGLETDANRWAKRPPCCRAELCPSLLLPRQRVSLELNDMQKHSSWLALAQPDMIRPGLEPGISGFGGRRLIH